MAHYGVPASVDSQNGMISRSIKQPLIAIGACNPRRSIDTIARYYISLQLHFLKKQTCSHSQIYSQEKGRFK